jgi:hypothetical protein
MLIIPKEKARFYYKIKNARKVEYCVEVGDKFFFAQFDNSPFRLSNIYSDAVFLQDITVNEEGKIHSFDDKPALIYQIKNSIFKKWFMNGFAERKNKEKPYCIEKGKTCYFGESGFLTDIIRKSNIIKTMKEKK